MIVNAEILGWVAGSLLIALGMILLAMVIDRARSPRRRTVAFRTHRAAMERALARARNPGDLQGPGASAFEHSRAPMLWLSMHGKIIRANESAATLFGYASDELVGLAYEDLLEEGQPDRAAALPTEGSGVPPRPREWRYRRKDGRLVEALESAVAVDGARGQHLVILVTLEDVTLRNRAEETIGLQSVLLNSLRHAVVATDLNGAVLYWSALAETLFGRRREDVLDTSLIDLAAPVTGREPVEEMIAEVGAGRTWSGEFVIQRGDRSSVSASVSAVPMRAPDGTVIGAVAMTQDSTGESETGRALQEERRTLELLNRTASVLSAKLDLKALLQAVMDAGIELTGAGFGALFFREGEHYELVALGGADRQCLGYGVGDITLDALPFVSSAILRSDDLSLDRICEIAASPVRPAGNTLDVASFLAVPLMSRSGDVSGGLFFTDAQAGRFSARIEKLMDGIASHASIAIENARLFHGARQEIETRRKTEQSLNESEARFRDFAQVASDILWETDVNHRIVSVVGDTIRALGAPSAAIIG